MRSIGPRRRERAWTNFIGWCRARRLQPLPAHPWTVAAYARWCEARHRPPVIALRVRAIARAHLLAGWPPPDRHPIVQRTLKLIEQRAETSGRRAALFPALLLSPATEPAARDDPPGRAAGAAVATAGAADGGEAGRTAVPRRRSMRSLPRLIARRPGRT
jgi:hypothetical protein